MIQLPVNLNDATTAHKLQGAMKKNDHSQLDLFPWMRVHCFVKSVIKRYNIS